MAGNPLCDVCKSRTVIALDDDALQLQILDLWLQAADIAPHCFTAPDLALEFAAQASSEVTLLVDLHIPGHDTAAFCSQIRKLNPAIRLVGMSATPPTQVVLDRLDGFVLKPMHPAELEAALCSCDKASTKLDEQIFSNLASKMPPAKLDSMYAAYFSDAARRMDRMEAAITAQSQEMFQEAAHSLKGSSGMLGIQWVAAMASVMESVDPMALPDRARSLMNSLYAEIDNARRVLAPRLEAVSSVFVSPSVVPSSPIGSKTS